MTLEKFSYICKETYIKMLIYIKLKINELEFQVSTSTDLRKNFEKKEKEL